MTLVKIHEILGDLCTVYSAVTAKVSFDIKYVIFDKFKIITKKIKSKILVHQQPWTNLLFLSGIKLND
jgi:D-ribose pyranose/furanose isomerase RbsD